MAGAWVTTQEMLAGYALAIVVSIPLAMWIAWSRFMEQSVYPVIVFLQIIPKIAVAPLFIIWFGFGFTPKLLVVFLLCFPIVVASIAGFKSADRDVMDFARTTGASGILLFAKIRLPQALRTSSPASRSARRWRRPPRSSPSSSPRTRAGLPAFCSTTASWRRRWCSRPSCCSR